MIRDLEQHLLKVSDRAALEYMREAVKCYGAGAYRAAVVLAMAASMDELRRKVNNLASSGGASKQLKQLSDSVISAHKDQEPFEKKLIDGRKKLDIISPAEHTKLELLLKTRNLCAHPSGHTGTAEEARDVITSLIDIILAQPSHRRLPIENELMFQSEPPPVQGMS